MERRREVAHLSRVATVGELSGALAHELAQPLAAIMSNAQVAGRLLQREPFDVPLLREILQDIVSDDRRGANVIRHLRDLLRKEDSPRELLDLRDLVREVLSLQRSDLVEHEIEVTTRFDDQPMLIIGDRVQLEQVLLNVIMNARDAMEIVPARKRRLKVEIDQVKDAVRVSVSDSGVGITRANLQRIFESFYTTKPKGLGLGLPICRAIIDDHGGSLWAESEGAGAILRIALPAQRDVRDAVRDVGRAARVVGFTTGSRQPLMAGNQQPAATNQPRANG
jgi:C4-dicarboxylate-specific signal transduction histidine kinase